MTGTYNSPTPDAPGHTLGGYSQRIVVDYKFVLKITHPEEQLAAVAPLLCAGITTYSPLRHWNAGPGKSVAIGGLGHMGVKLAHAMGAGSCLHDIGEQARGRQGARSGRSVVSATPRKWRRTSTASTLSRTVAASHQLDAYTNLLSATAL